MWHEGRTYFHKDSVHPDLMTYWPLLNNSSNATVLVPLCGKSLDMLWLAQQGAQVIGIELCEEAVRQFANEHQLSFQRHITDRAVHYHTASISIWVTDIFTLMPSLIPSVDAIYDRAALIALPEKLRIPYVDRCLQWLKPQGTVLLKTLSYDQSKMEGPPFSVSEEEVTRYYKEQCSEITRVKTSVRVKDSDEFLFERGLEQIKDSVWTIRKK